MSKQKVAVIGVGQTKLLREQNPNPLSLALEAIKKACEDAGVKPKDIEGFYMPQEAATRRFIHMRCAQIVSEWLEIPVDGMIVAECGGTTAMQSFRFAMNEILLGRQEVSMVLALEREKYDLNPAEDLKQLIDMTASYGPFQTYGMISPLPMYGMVIQRYMHDCGVTEEEIANLCVVLREHALKNPNAMTYGKGPLTVEKVMKSRYIAPPIKLLETAQMADAAACVILCSEEKAKQFKKPVFITGYGEYHDASHIVHRRGSLVEFPAIKESARKALKDAGRKIEDIDVAEIYGAFAGSELITYEDCGFFKKGEAPKAVWKGQTKIGGQIPINPSGGRLSLGHPPFVTPLLEIVEIAWQLRGEAGERQVKNARVGLAQAEHGVLDGSAVAILEAPAA